MSIPGASSLAPEKPSGNPAIGQADWLLSRGNRWFPLQTQPGELHSPMAER